MTAGVEKQISANTLSACTQFTPHSTLTLPANMSVTRERAGAQLQDSTFPSGSASNNQGLSTAGAITASSNLAGQPAPPARPALAPQLQVLLQAVPDLDLSPRPSDRPSTPPQGPTPSLDRTFERVEAVRHERRRVDYLHRLNMASRPVIPHWPREPNGYEIAQARVDDERQDPPAPASRSPQEQVLSARRSTHRQSTQPTQLPSPVLNQEAPGLSQPNGVRTSVQSRQVILSNYRFWKTADLEETTRLSETR
jgi:hypothetical protein